MNTIRLTLVICLLPFMARAGDPQGVVEGNNRFAFKLFSQLAATPGMNLFCSPFSISTALAMTYAGARGETERQIAATMEFASGGKFHREYKVLLDDIIKSAADRIKLNIANGMWVQKDFTFLDSYFDPVKKNYGSPITKVDFKVPGEREIARQEINGWVEEKTSHKITNLLSPGDLNDSTRLVLVNAIYFYGQWADTFHRDATRPDDFLLARGAIVKVPFMRNGGRYNYYKDSKIRALEIPYKDNKASMILFLPVENEGISKFEKTFGYTYYNDILSAFQSSEVQLILPKFKTEYHVQLASTLSGLGMPLAFDKHHADFSGMTGSRELCISKVIHQALIEVDEKGTEAAAATAVVMDILSVAPHAHSDVVVFKADHPFIFIIRDNATGAILFMGRVMDPGREG